MKDEIRGENFLDTIRQGFTDAIGKAQREQIFVRRVKNGYLLTQGKEVSVFLTWDHFVAGLREIMHPEHKEGH